MKVLVPEDCISQNHNRPCKRTLVEIVIYFHFVLHLSQNVPERAHSTLIINRVLHWIWKMWYCEVTDTVVRIWQWHRWTKNDFFYSQLSFTTNHSDMYSLDILRNSCFQIFKKISRANIRKNTVTKSKHLKKVIKMNNNIFNYLGKNFMERSKNTSGARFVRYFNF